jgi:hypothetical protein
MHRLLYILGFLVFTIGCHSSKKSHKKQAMVYLENSLSVKAKNYNPQFNWLKAKLNISGSDVPVEVNANLRMKKDSVIWISASVGGFPVAKLVFTKDTVIVLDNYKNRYFAGNYAKINDSLKTNLSFALLQSVLLGEFYPLYHDSVYTSYQENLSVLYCTPNREQMDLALQSKTFSTNTKTHHAIWLENDSSRVQRVYYQEPLKKVILDILYLTRHDDDKKLPKVTEVKMKGRDEKESVIRLEMNRIETPDKALETEITIPQGYVRIK